MKRFQISHELCLGSHEVRLEVVAQGSSSYHGRMVIELDSLIQRNCHQCDAFAAPVGVRKAARTSES